jgi:hypothetical protein
MEVPFVRASIDHPHLDWQVQPSGLIHLVFIEPVELSPNVRNTLFLARRFDPMLAVPRFNQLLVFQFHTLVCGMTLMPWIISSEPIGHVVVLNTGRQVEQMDKDHSLAALFPMFSYTVNFNEVSDGRSESLPGGEADVQDR